MIKKSLGIIAALIVIFAAAAPSFATAPTLSISGSSTVRAGDTITLKVYLNGTGLLSARGKFVYDASRLTYQSYGGTISGWSYDVSSDGAGNITFICIDDAFNSTINSSKQLISLTFKVKSGLSTGTNIKVYSSGVEVSDGNADYYPSATYSVNLAAPLSGNTNLKSLTVGNATISPAFSSGTTSYSASVSYDISRLSVSAAAEDSGAKVSVSGTDLSVGQNTVTIVVTAPNGATKTYTISVTRAQDPNYVPSSNANLKTINLSAGILSPAFDPAVTEYAVYLPYELSSITIGGEAEDERASDVAGVEQQLELGENRLKITVTAENGSTKDYYVTVFRMPQYNASSETEATTAAETTDPAETAETTELENPTEDPEEGLSQVGDVPFWTLVVVGIVCAMTGFGAGYFVTHGHKEQ